MILPPDSEQRPLIGISACLSGQRVRYDGKDKFNALVAEHIAPYCRLLPLCPEAIAGLGIPRPPVNLIQTNTGIRVLGRDNPTLDVTERLHTVADIVAKVHSNLAGFILQSRSPSCGLNTTPILNEAGAVVNPAGSGILAATLQSRFPEMPLLNDNELDLSRIALFLQQVRAYDAR